MILKKAQIGALLAATALFFGLYFGFDTRPGKNRVIDHSRAIQGEQISFENILKQAKSSLTPEKAQKLEPLEQQLQSDSSENGKTAALKKISAFWYDTGHLAVAGEYAEQVAETENADSSWSVAGALFYNALTTEKETAIRDFCASHAVKAFENAASLAPEKVEHRVNLALVWAENPPPDNPMKAVLMLLDLEKKYPDSPAVYNALGRLAIKTGQWQRAVERLEKSWSLNKNNPNTPCLLAKAYEGAGNTEKSTEFAALCKGR